MVEKPIRRSQESKGPDQEVQSEGLERSRAEEAVGYRELAWGSGDQALDPDFMLL